LEDLLGLRGGVLGDGGGRSGRSGRSGRLGLLVRLAFGRALVTGRQRQGSDQQRSERQRIAPSDGGKSCLHVLESFSQGVSRSKLRRNPRREAGWSVSGLVSGGSSRAAIG